MVRIKDLLRKFKFRLKHDFLTAENLVLLFAIGLCLTWTCQSIAAMSRNWELSERLTTERKKLELLTIEVEAAELANEYYRTTEYQELTARKILDKKLPGEKKVVMPENSLAAKTKHKESAKVDAAPEEKEYSNFEKWMMYLFPKY